VPPPPQAAAGALPASSGRGETTGAFLPPPPEKKSNTGMMIGIAAAVLAALGVAGYMAMSKEPPPPVAAPVPQGPSVDELRAQIAELVSAQADQISADYEARLEKLQGQLTSAQKSAEERQKRDAEAARAPAPTTPTPAPVAAAPVPTPTPAQTAPQEEPKPAASEPAQVPATPAPEVEAPKPAPPPVVAPTQAARPATQVRRGDLVESGAGVTMPQLVRRPVPRYPEMARRFNAKGATVLVKVLVDENGKVIKAEVAGGEQKFGFDAEALAAAKKSVYVPASKDGVPVKIWHTLSIEFREQ
jgi:TonB family protein